MSLQLNLGVNRPNHNQFLSSDHYLENLLPEDPRWEAVVEDFWLDLEGVTAPDAFDTLRYRGKWESSLWKEEACRPFVEEESRSTRNLDDSLGWNEECFKAYVTMLPGSVGNFSGVVKVYRKHHPRYRELADHLIDQIVYQLYGLTEDEIAIVEGSGNE